MRFKQKREKKKQPQNVTDTSIQDLMVDSISESMIEPYYQINQSAKERPAYNQLQPQTVQNLKHSVDRYGNPYQDRDKSGDVAHLAKAKKKTNDRIRRVMAVNKSHDISTVQADDDQSQIGQIVDIHEDQLPNKEVDIFRPNATEFQDVYQVPDDPQKQHAQKRIRESPKKEITQKAQEKTYRTMNSRNNMSNREKIFMSEVELSNLEQSQRKQNNKMSDVNQIVDLQNTEENKAQFNETQLIQSQQSLTNVLDLNKGNGSSNELNMNICYAFAKGNDESSFKKSLNQIKKIVMQDPSDQIATRCLAVFGNLPYKMVDMKELSNEMKACMNDSLLYAIANNNKSIAFSLTQFSAKKNMKITIHEEQLPQLIIGKMYDLIQNLVGQQAYLRIRQAKVSGFDQLGMASKYNLESNLPKDDQIKILDNYQQNDKSSQSVQQEESFQNQSSKQLKNSGRNKKKSENFEGGQSDNSNVENLNETFSKHGISHRNKQSSDDDSMGNTQTAGFFKNSIKQEYFKDENQQIN